MRLIFQILCKRIAKHIKIFISKHSQLDYMIGQLITLVHFELSTLNITSQRSFIFISLHPFKHYQGKVLTQSFIDPPKNPAAVIELKWLSNLKNISIINKDNRFMQNKRKAQKLPPSDSYFSLQPLHPSQDYSQTLFSSFIDHDQSKQLNLKKFRKDKLYLNYPIFNRDRNHTSPTFVLRSDRKYYRQNKSLISAKYQEKFLNYSEEKSELNVPKPKWKSDYCSVCKAGFRDYLKHTEAAAHQREVRRSPFWDEILELEEMMRQEAMRMPNGKKSGMTVESAESPEMMTGEQAVEEEGDVDMKENGQEADILVQVKHHELMRQVHEPIPQVNGYSPTLRLLPIIPNFDPNGSPLPPSSGLPMRLQMQHQQALHALSLPIFPQFSCPSLPFFSLPSFFSLQQSEALSGCFFGALQ